MCPVRVANVMLAAFAVKQLFFNPTEIIKQTKTRQNENRDIGNRQYFQSCVRS
jgi:hypothetical protein